MIGRTGWIFIVMLGCLGCQSADGQTPDVVTPGVTAPQAQPEPSQAPPVSQETQAHDAPLDASGWLELIEARTREFRTLHAKVRYVTIQGLLQDEQIRVGDLYYRTSSPEQDAPEADAQSKNTEQLAVHFQRESIDGDVTVVDRWLVFDGHWLLDQDHQRKQATRRQIAPEARDGEDHAHRAQLPLPIRLERKAVEQRYAVSLTGPEDDAPENTVGLVFSPRPDQAAEPFTAWFSRDTLLPARADTGDPDGDQTRIELLTDWEVDADVDHVSFSTQPPNAAGWDVQIVPLEENAGH